MNKQKFVLNNAKEGFGFAIQLRRQHFQHEISSVLIGHKNSIHSQSQVVGKHLEM
jgi:hypothetical protein